MPADHDHLAGLLDQLGDRFDALTSGDDWLAWLSTARTFHRYSPQNQLLLAMQGATGHVASYRTWQRLTDVDGNPCQVARGAKGLSILAPLTLTRRDVDEATGDEIVVGRAIRGFKVVKVFHQGQLVSPPAIPEPVMPSLLTGPDRHHHVWLAVVAHLEGLGYDVALVTRPPFETWNGRTLFRESSVEVADHLEPPQRLKTLLHEWAHISLEHDQRPGLPTSAREVEAESVAYLLCAAVGIDSVSYTVPYLAGWAGGDRDEIVATAQRVLAVAASSIDTLEHHLGVDLTPDLLTERTTSTVTAMTEARPGRASADQGRIPTVTLESAPPPTLPPDVPVDVAAIVGRLPNDAGRRLLDALAAADLTLKLDQITSLLADAGLTGTEATEFFAARHADPVDVHASLTRLLPDHNGDLTPLFDDVPDAHLAHRRESPSFATRPAGGPILSDYDKTILAALDLNRAASMRQACRILCDAGTDADQAARLLADHGARPDTIANGLRFEHYEPVTGEHLTLWPPDDIEHAINHTVTASLTAATPANDLVARQVPRSGDSARLAALCYAVGLEGDAAARWLTAVNVAPDMIATITEAGVDHPATAVRAVGGPDPPRTAPRYESAAAILRDWDALSASAPPPSPEIGRPPPR